MLVQFIHNGESEKETTNISKEQLLVLRDTLDDIYYKEYIDEGRIVMYSDNNFRLGDAESFIANLKKPKRVRQFSDEEINYIRKKLLVGM